MRKRAGFTLIELAITLAVVGVLLTGILVPVVSQVAARGISVTERSLEQIKEALLGYAAANGRLPCPASATSDGVEAFAAAGPAGNEANGRCASFYGFVPAVTLGVGPIDNNGYAVDGWGLAQNRIRYAVHNHQVTPPNGPYTFTSFNGMKNAGIPIIAGAGTPLFYVCGSGIGVNAGVNCGAAQTLTRNAPVVIWSVGPNSAIGGVSPDEAENPNPRGGSEDVIFVSHGASNSVANPFDDILTWVGAGTLVNRMMVGGMLP
jgi:prepilin-type N-terminal cleavage/methylation domain-containing protein